MQGMDEFDSSSDFLSAEAMKGTAGQNLYNLSWNNLIPLVTDDSTRLARTNPDF
jgi:hypothetical protein